MIDYLDSVLGTEKVIPVAKIESIEQAKKVGATLQSKGVKIIEVTFRTSVAPEVIKYLSENTELFVGAGTVINKEQVDIAKNNGAKFIVSPGISNAVIKRAQKYNLPIFPGVVTPSEIIKALKHGIKILKFFPASNYGGISMLKALSGPFPDVKFIPTGGVNEQNKDDYLALNNVFAVGGTWVLKD
jgi:2-dehydro-3-deoxyphosphogluconate aldolase/(4S)-4-hydroxy-2-oxoglutarate aldolase